MPTKSPKAASPSRLIGYARVSTEEQGTDPQLDELRAAGCATVLEEHASGADRSRPVLARLLHEIRPGHLFVKKPRPEGLPHADKIAESPAEQSDWLCVGFHRGTGHRSAARRTARSRLRHRAQGACLRADRSRPVLARLLHEIRPGETLAATLRRDRSRSSRPGRLNSLGTINPVERLAAWAHEQGAIMVVDAAQAAPHRPIDVQALGCDFLGVLVAQALRAERRGRAVGPARTPRDDASRSTSAAR